MKINLKRELPVLAIVLLPFIYLAFIWNDLPDILPMHWNIKGEVDRFGSKNELLLLPFLLPVLTYLIFFIGPLVDPKNKLSEMGSKFQNIKFWMSIFMSALAIGIIYLSANHIEAQPTYIISALGFLYLILGNYFKTIRPNYFIGLRTPWTLESETVWKASHQLTGKLFFIGGLLTIVLGFALDSEYAMYSYLGITLLISIIAIVYSYLVFQKEKNAASNA